MISQRATKVVASLAGLFVFGLSACGGEDGESSNSSGQESTSSAEETSSGAGADEASAVVPDDLCALVLAEDVSAVVAETVVVGEEAEPGACIYQAASAEDLVVALGLVQEGEAGGIEGARSQMETAYGGSSTPVTVIDNEGFVVSGTQNGRPASAGAVALETGLLVIVTLANGDPERHAEQITQLLELTMEVL